MNARLASALLHFLWQGTAIAVLYAAVRRVRRPESRYLLSCTALLLMAIAPFVTFCLAGPGEPAHSPYEVVGAVATSATHTDAIWLPATVAVHGSSANWIVLAWFMGAIVFSARLAGGWIVAMRIRTTLSRPTPSEWQGVLNRLCAHLRTTRPVRLVVSTLVQVPTVVGWLRPVILVPFGALTGLEPQLVEALLAHELAHIRRHDYLINVLQGVVEALLFYHPAVWWVSSQIRAERELCCDDIAVSVCGDTLTYVRALTELESHRSWQPALAANGGSLSARIARLLGMTRRDSTSPMLPVVAVALLIIAAFGLTGQSAPLPAFEVASIKPSGPDTPLKVDFAPGGRLVVSHATLRFLMKIAYDVTDDQIIGGSEWINSKRFDLQAKPDTAIPGDPLTMTKDQILLFHGPTRLRLQRLLTERFQLEWRKESKSMPIFALVAGRNGPKMTPDSTPGSSEVTFAHGILTAKRMDMPALAKFLAEGQVGRPVIDDSGLTGKFDFKLEWNPDYGINQATGVDNGGVSVFTALQQQLGLKLDPRTSSADTMVVTRAELPTQD